jgi:YHS domain-containing protein
MFRSLMLVLLLFVPGATLLAAEPAVYTSTFSSTAAGGYDVVAYFTERKPVEGISTYSTEYNGVTWQFASADNLARFEADPEKFAPAYGGYCAWAVSQGYLAKGSPEYWTVIDGRLYLNYNQAVQNDWLKDTGGFIKMAEKEWPTVLNQ